MGHGIGVMTRGRACVAVALCALLATAAPLVVRASSGGPAAPSQASALVSLVGTERAAAGVEPLAASAALDTVASAHAERMAASGAIFHSEDLAGALTSAGIAWTSAGENVGMGRTVGVVEDALMASDAHRHNILDTGFDAIGIGVALDNIGTVYVAQVFAQVADQPVPTADGTPLAPASSCAIPVTAEDGSIVPASFYDRSC
jgi:uncharacterized protein YkwD